MDVCREISGCLCWSLIDLLQLASYKIIPRKHHSLLLQLNNNQILSKAHRNNPKLYTGTLSTFLWCRLKLYRDGNCLCFLMMIIYLYYLGRMRRSRSWWSPVLQSLSGVQSPWQGRGQDRWWWPWPGQPWPRPAPGCPSWPGPPPDSGWWSWCSAGSYHLLVEISSVTGSHLSQPPILSRSLAQARLCCQQLRVERHACVHKLFP